ncbi:site-specific DNA-methyltransferase [Thermoanaerobacter sp. A7A]|uniref:site-specific DNA-methyltransferase n=1 Tax=Thermoanaerobacter sp. A7A TaxID=1350366 RepID=UPI00041AC1F2|nr:site-specific DNA-methyltransferase [Thermoanaerobacter sp. A7A]
MENKVSKEIFNPVQDNIKKFAELFPAAVKDGQVDFEALKQELGQFEEVGKEKYELTWPGKTLAKQLALTDVVGKTLKYVPEESKNPDTTENLYIEGDNLEVLKLLRNSYYGKIKMIYIDPPYNTGNDFIYKDDFKKLKEESDKEEGELDENGERLIKNQRSSARFHSNWLNMMYPRLKVAKDLLSDDGVIFISIDDNEVANLRKICDEIFGEENFISTIIWEKKYGIQNDAKWFSTSHDYIIAVAKNKEVFRPTLLPRTDKQNARYKNPDNDPRGPWISDNLSVGRVTEKDIYEIITPSGRKVLPPPGNSWRVSKEKFEELVKDNRIWFGEDGNNVPRIKRFLSEVKNGITPKTIWEYSEVGHTDSAAKELRALLKGSIFDYPKPVDLVKRCIHIGTKHDSIVLDFFSGSATTAHAVMELNAEDGGKRKFIMVQLPERVDEESEAYKAGFKTIADIGKERIRRAGEKIKEEFKDKEWIDDLDIGFKVFKVGKTNIRWNDDALKGEQITLSESALSVKDALDFNPGFTDIDVVYEIMLRHRDFPLTSKIEKLTNIGNRTYMFADSVVVCLEETITSDIVDKIASLEPKPIKIIFRDSAFDDDISLKLNILHRLDTQIKLFNQGKDQTYRVEFI